jgi:hypothetical protein
MLLRILLMALLIGVSFFGGPAWGTDPAQAQEQTQSQEQEQIFGSQLMTPEERAAYRDRLRAAKTAEEREKIRQEHHELMEARAKERGVTLPEEPPPSGMRPGDGMGPGGGGGRNR